MQAQLSEGGPVTAVKMTLATENLTARVDHTLSSPHRLTVVRRSELLDTQSEETFDSLSRLAATLIGTRASFLSVVDGTRDFYKSQCGLPEPLASERQLSGRTFCHYVVAGSVPLVIDDTHAHPTWRAVPVVESLDVRAYLGVPVMVDGQPIGSFSVVDSSPRHWKASEIETLVQLSLAATREIELRLTLKVAKAEAERANGLAKVNEEMLAVVIHDLRTPLQIIRMSATLLSRTASLAQRAHLDRIVRATESVRSLADTLVPTGIPRKSGMALRSTLIPSAKLLEDALDAMGTVAERAGINLVVDPDCEGTVLVDYPQMLRVLGNLIGNCVKYCPPGSSVRLNAREIGESVFISISDNGPGMSIADQEHAFVRGWQGKNGLSRDDGSGLGLTIVRALVEQNEGSVTLTSRPDCGTEVLMKMPSASNQWTAIAPT
jgi:signal transduction histidine kinase